MSTDRQIAANQINAQKSTGPRSLTGKARAALNALKHGLTGKDIVLPNEDASEFDSFRMDLLASLAPVGELEAMLAEKIVADAWRLRRVPKLEAAIYRRSYEERVLEVAQDAVNRYAMTDDERVLASLSEKTVLAGDRQAHENAETTLKEVRTKLDEPPLYVARVLQITPNALTNLWRHEAALFRSMQRALHEFQRLQAVRAGEPVAAPEVVDFDIQLLDHDRD